MKFINIIFIVLLLTVLSCSNSSDNETDSSDTLEDPQPKKSIDVGIYVYDYPFGYLSNGIIGGFDYDLMKEISKISDIEMNFIPMRFEQLLPSLEAHNIDAIIAGMTITEDRKKLVNFSDKYYTSRQSAVVMNDNNTINSNDDLIGKKVGVIKGTVADNIISANEGINIERFDTSSSIILALKVGKVDAGVFDRVTSDHYAIYDDDIKIAEGVIFPEENYGIAVRKEDTDLLNQINRALSEILTNGSYDQIVEKHLGSNMNNEQ